MKRGILLGLTLCSSMATLICCALPALLVTLGLGATLAAAVSAVPQLTWFSEQKELVFLAAGGLLAAGYAVHRRAMGAACPADPELARACGRGRRVSSALLIVSVALYLTGAFFAFLAPVLMG